MSGRFGGGGWGFVDSIWNVMAHVTHGRGKWRGNWRMEWVACTLHTASEHGVSSITTADAHTSAVSSRLNWRPRRYKWTLPFRRKTKSGFYACATTFQSSLLVYVWMLNTSNWRSMLLTLVISSVASLSLTPRYRIFHEKLTVACLFHSPSPLSPFLWNPEFYFVFKQASNWSSEPH